MALATDLIFRPLESPAQEAPNRRLANPGSGEEFSELLSKARTSQTEPLGTAPQELALAQAAPPPLPLGAGLATLPAFSQDGLLGVSAAGEPALGQPATDIAGTILPGIESAELAAGSSLVAATQTGPGLVDPRSTKAGIAAAGPEGLPVDSLPAIQSAPEPANPKALPEVARKITVDADRIVLQTPAEIVLAAPAGRLEVDQNTASSIEATPQIAEPALAKAENPESVDAGTVPATDASKPLVLPTAAASQADAGASADLNVPAGEIAASAPAFRDGSATRTEKGADRSAETSTHSEPATLAAAPTSAFSLAAATLDVQTVSQPITGAVPAVAASGPAINPRSIAKPDSGQVSDTPSSGPSLPVSDTLEFADVLGTGERLAASEAPSSSTQGAPALAAVASAPAAIQSSSISVAAPPAMAPANAILVASPADITSIVSTAADNGDADRIVIQLDPPELGRVSIDFKFDANGLQHVTVTGESPEAMRQLRLMHFELTQALERHGITSQNMSFQQQQQNAQHSPTPNPFARQGLLNEAGGATALEPVIANNNQTSPRMPPGGRLDMKL
jgi:flagellar hook-length control protein FliK